MFNWIINLFSKIWKRFFPKKLKDQSQKSGDLLQILKDIGGNPYEIIFVRQNLFEQEWSEKKLKQRARCHVQAAHSFLTAISKESNKEVYTEQFNATLADLTSHISLLDSNVDISPYILSPNTIPSIIHYKHAESLFFSRILERDDRSTYALDLLVVNALRLALEKRINGMLGIDFLLDGYNNPVGLNKKLKLVKSLNKVTCADEVNWDEIQWVNTWMNHHIHRQMRPYPWAIYQAFEVLNHILLPGKLGSTGFSYYASTVVLDEDEFHDEIVSYLKREFPDYKVKWSGRREIYIPKRQ